MGNKIFKNRYTLLDGAMGTMLQKKGMPIGTIPETLNIEKPEWTRDIHKAYVEAGAEVLYTNTFGANRYKIEYTNYTVEQIVSAGVKNAKMAAKGSDVLVALDVGPLGQLLEPVGSLTFDEAYDAFKEVILAGSDADIIVIETMTDLQEARAAVLAAKENSAKPVICTMTFEENHRTFTGCSVSAMCITLEGLGVDALGVNCSLGPLELLPIVEEIADWTTLPIVVKANAGLPDPLTNEYNISPDDFSNAYRKMADYGATIFGGCCGTTPEYTRSVKTMLVSLEAEDVKIKRKTPKFAVCSPRSTVKGDRPRIVGERINPTGKKRFQRALVEKDMDYILERAMEQADAGAEILDVNVGFPGINEKEMMVDTVKALQSVTDLPLQIDSTKPEVIEAALRIYSGKAIINSVNAEDEVMENIFPIAAKYGAAVIGLTLDKDGIPKEAKNRVKLAKKIADTARKYGIKDENIIIDNLTLTVSAQQEAAKETLKAVDMVKNQLGLKTILGVSNISFGLPERENVNRTFLIMALERGLDMAIINPNVSSMVWAVRAYNVLANIDKNSMEYIEEANLKAKSVSPNDQSKIQPKEAAVSDLEAQKENKLKENVSESFWEKIGKETDEKTSKTVGYDDILKAMESGMKSEGSKITESLLNTMDAMDIINNALVPALDTVGDKFEKGTVFLPQLILAADVAKECFEVIKKSMSQRGISQEKKGKIILATVKGDIHDIGKNIVKAILENYGYDVIDLGRDVDYMKVVNTAIEQDVHLVGLSALMTTTLPSMAETIRLLREHNVNCKVMVGGAVLTKEYAMRIGADYYAKDAKMSADISKEVLG